MDADALLRVRRRLVDRNDRRAGRRVGLLSHMNRARRELHAGVSRRVRLGTARQETDDVLTREYADRLAFVGHQNRWVRERQQFIRALDLIVVLEDRNARPITSATGWWRMSA